MSLRKTTRVRLTDYQFRALQQIALHLNCDISTVIRAAVDDAISTLNRWTNLEIEIENEKESFDE